jgi:hypothetical protein
VRCGTCANKHFHSAQVPHPPDRAECGAARKKARKSHVNSLGGVEKGRLSWRPCSHNGGLERTVYTRSNIHGMAVTIRTRGDALLAHGGSQVRKYFVLFNDQMSCKSR